MLKQLIKKQFFECFRSYFVNPKTGKRRSKGGIIGYLILFAFLMLFLCGTFFAVGAGIGITLIEFGLDTLFFILMGLMSLLLGVFGSAFNTYSTLYLAKDNELLLAMPIKPRDILLSRIALVYGLGLLYGGVVWLPAIVTYIIFGNPTALAIIFDILLLPVIALFITVITCALGYVIAKISTKLKGKSFITVITSLVFLVVYYIVCFRASDIIDNMISNGEVVLDGFKKYGNILYLMGTGATGNVLGFMVFLAVSLILGMLVIYILNKSFTKIVTTSSVQGKKKTKEEVKVKSSKKAIMNREFKRFTSSATYMLNCGLGVIFVLAIPVVLFIKRSDITSMIAQLDLLLPEAVSYIILALVALPSVILAINGITGPSIALEGKTLWIIKSLPISTKDILISKRNVQLYVNGIPGAIATIASALILKMDFSDAVLCAVTVFLIVGIQATVGLLLGLRHPNFDWTNEAVPIKQDASLLLLYLINMLIPIILCGAYFLVRNLIGVDKYMYILLIVSVLLSRFVDSILLSKGVKKFESL